jgi:sugar O-acyltransferase (sialic acid O-acetyltransferase NeuD family)
MVRKFIKDIKSKNLRVFIWGAGGQGKVVLDILRENKNVEILGFIDDEHKLKGKVIDGVKVLGDRNYLEDLRKKGVIAGIVAIGENKIRCELADYLRKKKFRLIDAIHPSSLVANNTLIGSNILIAMGAIICAHTIIEDNAVIYSGAIIEHESILKNGAYISPGVKLAGKVEVGEKAFLGIGVTVIQNIKIGSNSIVGAGAVVLEDIPDNVVAVGIPAKIIKKIEK